MDKDYFSNGAILPPLQFEPMIPLSSLHSNQELNSISVQSSNSFPNTHWDNNSTEQYTHFNSALSSIVSSPVASNSLNSNSLGLQELIGKLGTICGPYDNSNINNNINSDSTMTSCYTTPLNSPPKLHIPIIDQLGKSNISILGNAVPMNPASFPNHSADPRFTHRAAKLSCLGSRSFNDRTSQAGLNNENLPRVSSSPSLKKIGSPIQNQNLGQLHVEKNCARIERNANCNEESSISEQVPSELSCRKRKAVSRGKGKKNGKSLVGNVVEAEDGSREKISKSTEDKMEESKGSEGDETEKEAKEKEKVVEPPKDYIHVRARRGEATDSHSLAERVRREKISQRMKLLQDLVPGCNKVTGKAVMLDEIINYVQSLQRQVEFLSMKLASVNPRLDFHIDNLLPKDICQLNGSLTQHVPLNGYGENLTQFPTICEDDLQSIVQMGFSQNSNQDLTLHSQTFSVPNSTSYMKIEM